MRLKLPQILALAAIAFASLAWAGELRAPSKETERFERKSKIDPRVLAEFDEIRTNLELKTDSEIKPGSTKDVRVIINLTTNSESVTFANAGRVSDPVAAVKNSVAQAQNEFFTVLNDIFDSRTLGPNGSMEIINTLSLNYGVVALIRDEGLLDQLTALEEVAYIEYDKLNQLYTVQGRALVGSDVAAANGHTGDGIGVAVIDSHYDLLHSELGGSTSLPNGVVYGGQNFSDPGTSIHSQNFNDCYHGTGTASIVRRYAPDVDLYCHTVFPNAFDSVIAESINWCITNKNGVNGGAPIKIISMSLGGGRNFSECNSGTMHTAAGNALANGILVFAASGNDGWTDSMGSPACSNNVISVGSVWDENGAAYSPFPPANCSDSNRLVNERTCYSDTASFLDIYAPSEEVMCAQCGGGTWALGGTSSACPAAAGMTAQFLEAEPSYAGNKSALVSQYQSTGVSVVGDSSKRRIDLDAAIGGGSSGPTELSNGVPVSSVSGGSGSEQHWFIQVPSGATNLVISISGGSGDADLYTRLGSQATQSTYNCRPYLSGNNETCTEASPAAGAWYVMLHGYSAYSGVTLTASYTTGSSNNPPTASFTSSVSNLTASFTDTSTDSDGSIVSRSWTFGDGGTSSATNPSHTYASAGTYTVNLTVTDDDGATDSTSASVTVTAPPSGPIEITNGQTVTGLSASTGDWLHYYISVPSGASNLVMSISGGSGDADLYTRFGAQPTTSTYDCRPYKAGNTEECTVASPSAGDYYIGIRAYSGFSGLSLTASFTEPSSGNCTNGSLSGTGDADNFAYYYSAGSGVHAATLTGPGGTDFDLYLQKWNGSSWANVASSTSASSNESINYNGTAGYHRWRVYSYSGSGSYTLCESHP